MPSLALSSHAKRGLCSFVALVNLRSGGRHTAGYVYRKLSEALGADRVLVLFKGDLVEDHRCELRRFLCQHAPKYVIVAGGDGTVSFVMNVMQELHEEDMLPRSYGVLAPFPLGTGNDFSFTLGFGCGFSRWIVLGHRRFQRLMQAYEEATTANVDRWFLRVTTSASQHPCGSLQKRVLSNYFSVGFDAAVANRFNRFRSRHHRLLLSRPIIKLWYAVFAVMALFTEKKIGSSTLLEIDGRRVVVPSGAKSVAVCNMLTYAGGSVAWNGTVSDQYAKPSVSDGQVEVVCFYGIWHLAFVRLGWCYGEKLGQGRSVRIVSRCHSCQIDGEEVPGLSEEREPSTFQIDHLCTSECLAVSPQRELDTFAILFALSAFVVAILLILYDAFNS